MEEPDTPNRRLSTPDCTPVGWLEAGPHPIVPAEPGSAEALRAAIELVLANPEAVAEIITRARPTTTRHDGWTGERMATFLENLADTGLITEACRAAGMSREAAYQLRSRDGVFDAAWAAAQAKARPHVSDGLLERSITGTVEHYYRDGVLVGERRHYESWLGLAVLKRLDKQAEQDRADGALSSRIAGKWSEALGALRSGGGTDMLQAKVDEVDIPSPPGVDPADNVWQTEDGAWMTTFPPPAGFDLQESCAWDGLNWYERACTPEEVELVEAHRVAAEAAERAKATAYAEAQRDSWFAQLRTEIAAWS